MKYLDFEKHIKKELEGSKETVQMDALLASLHLGKQPKRKGFALWMILPFILLVLTVFAWKYVDFNQDNKIKSQFSTDGLSVEKTSNEIFETNKGTTQKRRAISEDENITTDLKPAVQGTVPNEEIEKNGTNVAGVISQQNIEKKESAKLSTFIKNNSSDLENDATNTTLDLNQEQLNKGSENDEIASANIYSKEASSLIISNDEGEISPVSNLKLSRSLLTIEDLSTSQVTIEDKAMDEALFSRMKINCPSFDNAGWHMALIPEVGVFLPKKTLTNNSLEESAAFTERSNSESTLEGIEIGLYGMLVRDNFPFYLKAGVSYSRITERMDLKYEYTKQDTTVGIISSTVSSNGDTITHIYGDIITETTFKGSNRQHYYIHLFDVPVAIGYTTYLGGFDIGIEGGVKVNFMTRATGNLLTTEKDYTNLSLNRLYKNRIGLSYFGGLMIGRNFGRFGDFYIAPRFTYYPNEFNNQNNNVGQKYFTIGLNAGVVYKIN
jgi:hypothetical protein